MFYWIFLYLVKAPVGSGFSNCTNSRNYAVSGLQSLCPACEHRGLGMDANPPGISLESEITAFIVSDLRPQRLAYLLCKAGTLSRDMKLPANRGYTLKRLIPSDFFPQARHMECLALHQPDEEKIEIVRIGFTIPSLDCNSRYVDFFVYFCIVINKKPGS